eukprot:GSA25T00008620001.1
MNDLVTEFKAASGYTHSDEITLIFDRQRELPLERKMKQAGGEEEDQVEDAEKDDQGAATS